jgi:hypothetical protein
MNNNNIRFLNTSRALVDAASGFGRFIGISTR